LKVDLASLNPEQPRGNAAHQHLGIAKIFLINSVPIMVTLAAPAGSEIVAEDGEHQAGLKWNRMIEKKHVIGVERWSAGNYGLGKSDRRD
jgi:hypothetical protein